jgi:hypothetical protein
VLEYRVILLLRTSAALLALSALALLIRPGTVIGLIGLTSSRELEWGFRLIGLLVASMGALMTLVAAFLGERGLRQTAAILMLTSVSFAILLLFSPGGWGLWHLLLVILELGLTAGYFFALKGRRRNR